MEHKDSQLEAIRCQQQGLIDSKVSSLSCSAPLHSVHD